MSTLIDFHTHILPGIDDGSDNLEMSLTMLQTLGTQQVTDVVLTPHYYSQREPLGNFIYRRDTSCARLKEAHVAQQPRIHVGAEVYFSDYLFNNRDLSSLCIEETSSMLIELPYNRPIDDRLLERVDRLAAEYLITPIMAHIERYPTLFRSTKSLEKLLDYGCVLQVNLSSFGTLAKRRLLSLLKAGYIGAIGTDAHNMTTRSPQYKEFYQILEKKAPSAALEELQRSMMCLISAS